MRPFIVLPLLIQCMQVFKLYKIPHLHIDGRTSFDGRAKIIAKFVEDPSIRVLFFTSVGSVGLNLSVANIIIFLVCLGQNRP
jgi:SNF2 family DNA or RNA helicase